MHFRERCPSFYYHQNVRSKAIFTDVKKGIFCKLYLILTSRHKRKERQCCNKKRSSKPHHGCKIKWPIILQGSGANVSLLSQVCLKVLIKDTVSYVCRYFILVRNSILRTFYFFLLIKTGVWIRCSGFQYIQENISRRARKHRYRQNVRKGLASIQFQNIPVCF